MVPGWGVDGPGQHCRGGAHEAAGPVWKWSASWDWHLEQAVARDKGEHGLKDEGSSGLMGW